MKIDQLRKGVVSKIETVNKKMKEMKKKGKGSEEWHEKLQNYYR